jgi:hypothetical protein
MCVKVNKKGKIMKIYISFFVILMGTISFVESASGTNLPTSGRPRANAVDGTDSEVENNSTQSNQPRTSRKRVKLNDSLSSNSDSQASEKTKPKKKKKRIVYSAPIIPQIRKIQKNLKNSEEQGEKKVIKKISSDSSMS